MASIKSIRLDQFWECPMCGTQIASGKPAEMKPPWCQLGHPRREMEQRTAEAFGKRGA